MTIVLHSLWYCRRQFVRLFVSFLLVVAAQGQCPSIAALSPLARIPWDLEIWTYSGSLSVSGIAAGVSAWNGRQSLTTFCSLQDCPNNGVDIFISDDTTLQGLGQEQSYGNWTGQSSCCLHTSSTCPTMCFNESKLYYATIKLNPTRIASTASAWGLQIDTVTQEVASHEVGHVFGLDNYEETVNCAAPQTIMSVKGSQFQCGYYTPQQCDTTAVYNLYNGWTIYSWATCGPTCDLNTSCQ